MASSIEINQKSTNPYPNKPQVLWRYRRKAPTQPPVKSEPSKFDQLRPLNDAPVEKNSLINPDDRKRDAQCQQPDGLMQGTIPTQQSGPKDIQRHPDDKLH